MDRSNRRGGENSARLDFSMRREMASQLDDELAGPAAFWFGSSCVGLRNSARFDVSRVAVPNFGAPVTTGLFPLFFNEDGVLRPKFLRFQFIQFRENYQSLCFNGNVLPGVRRCANDRRFGVATFSFRLNLLHVK